MLKNALLLSATLLLFSGCAERGYKLTVNTAIGTVTAEKSIDIRKATQDKSKSDIDKMQKAVKKEQTRGKPIGRGAYQNVLIEETPSTVSKIITDDNTVRTKDRRAHEDGEAEKKAAREHQLILEKEAAKEKATREHQLILEKEAAKEKEAIEARKRIEAQELTLQKAEKDRKLLELQKEKDREALRVKLTEEKKLAQFEKEEVKRREQEKLLELQKEKEAADLKRKLAKEKSIQIEKEKEARIAQEKEEKRLLAINEREEKENHKRKLEQKNEQKRLKALQERRLRESKKAPVSSTETLTFKPSTQTYQKFGTSEIHGHVIYLSPNGVEIFLKNTKIYLVAQNTKMDYWYNNYYLKNRDSSSDTRNIVNYMNATKLNLERNFAFYGLAPGNYYVVIESSYPKSMAKNKKVYIAKRITVEKYKKIMTVFSKKL